MYLFIKKKEYYKYLKDKDPYHKKVKFLIIDYINLNDVKYTKVLNETNTLNITDIKTITTARYGLENHWVDIKEDLDKLLTEKQSTQENINYTFDISSIKNNKYKIIHYISTRFSIFDPNIGGLRLKRNAKSTQEYKNKLFDEGRLNYKFTSFELVTLPSIKKQTYKNYIWYIFTSVHLPQKFKDRLEKSIKDIKQIKCIYIDKIKDFNKYKKESGFDVYSTIRLDDDDGLAPNFLENINKHINNNNKSSKYCISHINGVKITIENNKIKYGKQRQQKNNAQGLCAVNMDIYSCGNHTKVSDRHKTIHDKTKNMFLQNCNPEYCDSGRRM